MENRRVPVEAFLGPSVQLSLFPTNSTCSLEDPWEIAVYCESSKYHGVCVCGMNCAVSHLASLLRYHS